MKKMLVLFVLVFASLTATAGDASAQIEHYLYRGYVGHDGMSYEQAVLLAQTRKAERFYQQQGIYNPLGWPMQNFNGYGSMIQYPYGPYQGSWGRIVQGAGGNPYFDAMVVPCQVAEKSQRWQKGIATVALTTVAGAFIGGAAGGHAKKGALYGATAGTGIALLNNSRYCSPPQSTQLPVQMTQNQPMYQNGGGTPVPYQEQTSPQSTPTVVSSADPIANITWQTVNTTNMRAIVTDANTGEQKLIIAGGSISLREPAGEQPYTVVLLDPGRGKPVPIPGEIRASKDLQGWEIVHREEN